MKMMRFKSPEEKRAAAAWFKDHESWNLEVLTTISKEFGVIEDTGFCYAYECWEVTNG